MNHILIGKVITAIHLAADKQAIKFDIEGGEPIVARADGDCCSVSWIENVENAEALIGSPVLEALNIDMPDSVDREPENHDVVQFYGFKISTAKGTCVIDYRNDSNGYYGGSLEWPSENRCSFYGGVYGQNVSKEEWGKIA